METKCLKYWRDMPLLYCLTSVFDRKMKLDGVFILLDNFNDDMNVEVGILKYKLEMFSIL